MMPAQPDKNPQRRSMPLKYACAVLAVALAFGLRLLLETWVGYGLPPYITFYPFVMLSLILGAGPATLTTILSSLTAAYWILPPAGLAVASPVDRLGLAIYAVTSLIACGLAGVAHRYQAKATAFDRDAVARQSRERLAAFVEATFEGIVESEAGRIVDCNEQLARTLGYDTAEMKGMAISSLIAPEDRERVVANIREGQVSMIEHAMICKDGSRIIVEAHGRQVSATSGLRLTAIRDITARKQGEERLRLALAAARMATWDWHIPSGAVIWNEMHYRMLGYEPWGVEPSYQTWANRVHPDDLVRMEEIIARHMAEHRFYTAEYRTIWPDGTIHWVEVRGDFSYDSDGAPLRCYGGMLDITDHKHAEELAQESERQFRVLTQNLRSAVALINKQGEFAIVNQTFLRMFDLPENASIKNVNDRDWSQWQVFDEQGALLEVDDHPVRHAALTLSRVQDRLVAVKAPSSQDLKWILVSAEPLLDEEGKLNRIICTYHDITARKRTEEQIAEQMATLQRLNDELSRFNSVAVDRELRMIELKKEINALCARLGEPPSYAPDSGNGVLQ